MGANGNGANGTKSHDGNGRIHRPTPRGPEHTRNVRERAKAKREARGIRVPTLVPQPHGGALYSGGVPGNPGSTGRPPDAFKRLCRELASGEKTQEAVRKILEDKDHPQFVAALRWASENGYGRPEQRISGSIGLTVQRADALKLARERAFGR